MYDGRGVGLCCLRKHLEREKINYPVFHDASGRVRTELGVRFYPVAFLVGSDGKVVWEGAISGGKVRQKVEALVEQELRASKKSEDLKSRAGVLRAADEIWIAVAHLLGGSGTERGSGYRVVVPGRAGVAGPIWIEFSGEKKSWVLRATVILPRATVARSRWIFEREFPKSSRVVVQNDSSGEGPVDTLRLIARGQPEELAVRIRRALELMDPNCLRRVSGWGSIQQRTIECEPYWAIVTPSGEEFGVDKLAAPFRQAGLEVFFRGSRREAGRQGFSYFGGVGGWTADLKLESINVFRKAAEIPESIKAKAAPPIRDHARRLIDRGLYLERQYAGRFPRGFSTLSGPGFPVCPHSGNKLSEEGIEGNMILWSRSDDPLYFLSRGAMRILVIEDEPDLATAIRDALDAASFAVDLALDGEDGLHWALGVDYDAIVLDLMLPRLDGWSVLERVREIKQTPVLILTAQDALADRVRGLDPEQTTT